MNLLFCLESILSDFRFMFNSQNFALFQAFIYGFITHTSEGTLTQLSTPAGRCPYHYLCCKFLHTHSGRFHGNAENALVSPSLTQHLFGKQWLYL